MADILYSLVKENEGEAKAIFEEWRQKNIAVEQVIQGNMTFSSEIQRVRESIGTSERETVFKPKSDIIKAFEECIGQYRDCDLCLDLGYDTVGAGLVGAVIGLGAQSSLRTSETQDISRRHFIARGIYTFGIIGFVGGFAKNIYDRVSSKTKASFLDQKITELYK